MQFSVEAKALNEILSKARRVCPRAVDFNLVPGKKSGITLIVSADDRVAKFKLHNVSVEDSTHPITAPLEPVLGVIKGRKVLEFTSDGTKLAFTDGKSYKGTIQINEYAEIPLEAPEGGLVVDLKDPDNSSVFYQTVQDVTLSGSFSGDESMSMLFQMGKKGVLATCYDPYYMVRVTDNSATYEPIRSAVDLGILSTIQGLVGKGDSYVLTITENSVFATNSEFMVRFPAVQIESVDESMKNINSFISGWLEEAYTRAYVERDALDSALANVGAFYQRGTPIQFVASSKGLTVGIQSATGTIKAAIPCKVENPTKDSFNVEYQLLSEILEKIEGDTIPLSFLKDRLLYIHTDTGSRTIFASVALQS